MWSTSRPMTRGWSTDTPSWRGRVGIRTPESGLVARIFHSESASGSDGSAVLDGAGIIGDWIGITDTQCLTAAGTSPGAQPSITGRISIAAEARAGKSRAAGLPAHAAEFTTVLAQPRGLSTETGRRLEDTLNRVVRAASARAPSAAMSMAERRRAIRHAEAPVWVAEQRVAAGEDLVAEEAGVTNRGIVTFLVA